MAKTSFYMGAFVGAGSEEEVAIVCKEEVGYGGGFPSNAAPMNEAPVLNIPKRPSAHKINMEIEGHLF